MQTSLKSCVQPALEQHKESMESKLENLSRVLIQAKLDNWLAEVLEPRLQEQNDRQADRLGNLDGQMQSMLNSCLQAALEQHQGSMEGKFENLSKAVTQAK